MADKKIALPSYKGKKLLDDLSKGDILKRLNDEEYYTIDNIHNERISKNKFNKLFEFIGLGTRFLVPEKIMKKMFETEYFSSYQGKNFIIYYY